MAQALISLPRAGVAGIREACPETLAGLIAEVDGIVADPSVSRQDIIRALGRGLWAAAGATRLPGLWAEAGLLFGPGQGYAALPADMQHGPTDAFLLPGHGRVRLLPDLAALRRARRFGAPGRIRFAATGAGRLFVWPVPETDVEVVVGYYRLPDPLVALSDKPDCLPPQLAGPLLVSFACRELFERLEEGEDGKKPQTTAYARRFEQELAGLIAFFGPAVVQEGPVEVPTAFGEEWL